MGVARHELRELLAHFRGTVSGVYSQLYTAMTASLRASYGSVVWKKSFAPGWERSSTRMVSVGTGQAAFGSEGGGRGRGGIWKCGMMDLPPGAGRIQIGVRGENQVHQACRSELGRDEGPGFDRIRFHRQIVCGTYTREFQ